MASSATLGRTLRPRSCTTVCELERWSAASGATGKNPNLAGFEPSHAASSFLQLDLEDAAVGSRDAEDVSQYKVEEGQRGSGI